MTTNIPIYSSNNPLAAYAQNPASLEWRCSGSRERGYITSSSTIGYQASDASIASNGENYLFAYTNTQRVTHNFFLKAIGNKEIEYTLKIALLCKNQRYNKELNLESDTYSLIAQPSYLNPSLTVSEKKALITTLKTVTVAEKATEIHFSSFTLNMLKNKKANEKIRHFSFTVENSKGHTVLELKNQICVPFESERLFTEISIYQALGISGKPRKSSVLPPPVRPDHFSTTSTSSNASGKSEVVDLVSDDEKPLQSKASRRKVREKLQQDMQPLSIPPVQKSPLNKDASISSIEELQALLFEGLTEPQQNKGAEDVFMTPLEEPSTQSKKRTLASSQGYSEELQAALNEIYASPSGEAITLSKIEAIFHSVLQEDNKELLNLWGALFQKYAEIFERKANTSSVINKMKLG